MGYQGTDARRTYDFDLPESEMTKCKAKIVAINESIAAGTVEDFREFFVSDDGKKLDNIVEAKIVIVEETPVAIGGNA